MKTFEQEVKTLCYYGSARNIIHCLYQGFSICGSRDVAAPRINKVFHSLFR
jgi:hypothetical protein